MTGRAQPNVTRTLAKFEAAGFITMKTVGRRKTLSVAVKKIVVEIDPYSDRNRLRVAQSVQRGDARVEGLAARATV
jgi:predicted transcriptional regulator